MLSSVACEPYKRRNACVPRHVNCHHWRWPECGKHVTVLSFTPTPPSVGPVNMARGTPSVAVL